MTKASYGMRKAPKKGVKKITLKVKRAKQPGAAKNGDNLGLRGVRQGMFQVTNRAFGSPKPKNSGMPKTLCAMSGRHVSLPRAVGSYTVTKTTTPVTSRGKLMLFGCMTGVRENYDTGYGWLDAICAEPLGDGNYAINADASSTQGTVLHKNRMLAAGGYDHARMVPSAVSVQITCPAPISGAVGAVTIGRAKNVLKLCGNTRKWVTLADELTGLCSPRVCSASKLAFRGVKVDAIPYNMNVLSDFEPRGIIKSNGPFTWDLGTSATVPKFDGDFAGFSPIFVHNPNQAELNVLVTIEWRVRFDPSNPACAGHSYHPVTTDHEWNNLIRNMETRQGTGVLDISSDIADNGMS